MHGSTLEDIGPGAFRGEVLAACDEFADGYFVGTGGVGVGILPDVECALLLVLGFHLEQEVLVEGHGIALLDFGWLLASHLHRRFDLTHQLPQPWEQLLQESCVA